MDADRTYSPMIKPKDAFVLDTSDLSIIDAVNTAKSLVQRVISEKN